MIFERLINQAANRGVKAKLVVFNFHNIANQDNILTSNSISEKAFFQSIDWINDNFQVLSLPEGIETCRSGGLKKPSACITFDDGYKSHYSVAAKFLNSLKIKGAFFVSSKHLGSKLLWHDLLTIFEQQASNDQKQVLVNLLLKSASSKYNTIDEKLKYLTLKDREPILDYLQIAIGGFVESRVMMNENELINLNQQGHLVGGHTLNHPILSLESPETGEAEIAMDIKTLSNILGQKVNAFAFPNGKPNRDYGTDHLKVLQQLGIDYACSTAPGCFQAGTDPLQIPRFGLRGKSNYGFTKCVVSNLSSPPEFVEYRGYEAVN